MSDSQSNPPAQSSWLKLHLSRRRFLTLLSGTTALVAQACRSLVPDPTPLPSPISSPVPTQAMTPTGTATPGSEIHLPFVAKSKETATPSPSRTPSPTRTATSSPSPSATSTPSPTSTPSSTATFQPTKTPQPTATPQPPTVTPQPTAIPEPTVTPEPTAIPEPTAAPEPTATAEAVSIPEPTELALSEATATSEPIPNTPTLSSQATPFPPGAATKLGLFIGYQHPKLIELLQTGNIPFVKTLEYDPNLMEFIKQTSPNTIIVARYASLPQVHLANFVDPIGEARRFVDLLLPIATEPKRQANIDAWESYNEPVPNNPEEMKRLAEFEAERTRLLGQAGIRSCVGNFATGQPALELWPDFFPALQAAREYNGYLGLHEYSAPYMWFGSGTFQLQEGVNEGDEGWLTLRYRKVYRKYIQPAGLELPLLITETGIDGQVGNRPGPSGLGWQDFQDFWKNEGMVRHTAPGFYVEQLAWYDAELQQDYYVKGASIFALAAPSGWGSFELLGSSAEFLQQYIAVHPRR